MRFIPQKMKTQNVLTVLCRIYLIGCRVTVVNAGDKIPVADMIKKLIPEAHILEQHIGFNFPGGDLDSLHDEDENILAGQPTEANLELINAPSASVKREDASSTERNELDRPTTSHLGHIDSIDAKVTQEGIEYACDDSDDSESKISMVSSQFSQTWIEQEALALLDSIQKQTSSETTASRIKVVLAGYAFGGFVVKQV